MSAPRVTVTRDDGTTEIIPMQVGYLCRACAEDDGFDGEGLGVCADHADAIHRDLRETERIAGREVALRCEAEAERDDARGERDAYRRSMNLAMKERDARIPLDQYQAVSNAAVTYKAERDRAVELLRAVDEQSRKYWAHGARALLAPTPNEEGNPE